MKITCLGTETCQNEIYSFQWLYRIQSLCLCQGITYASNHLRSWRSFKKKKSLDSDAVALMLVTARGAACLGSCLKHLVKWAQIPRARVFMPVCSASFSPVLSVPDLPPCLPGLCLLTLYRRWGELQDLQKSSNRLLL